MSLTPATRSPRSPPPAGRGGIGDRARFRPGRAASRAPRCSAGCPQPRHATLRPFRDAQRRADRPGHRAVLPGAAFLHRRRRAGAAGPRRPGRAAGAARALPRRRRAARRARRVHRRAFLNGKLDLAQAEAVADLIDAASREAARSALRSLQRRVLRSDRRARGAADRAARADRGDARFSRGGHRLPASRGRRGAPRAGARSAWRGARAEPRRAACCAAASTSCSSAEPNVGKSSLLNRLAGEERAIVTPIPGTTRDALREPIQIEGVPLDVVDTAGLRESRDEVERLGIERTRQELERADLVIAVLEADRGRDAACRTCRPAPARIDVYNKIDLAPGLRRPRDALGVSAKTGAGLEALRRDPRGGGLVDRRGIGFPRARAPSARARRARGPSRGGGGRDARWEFFAEELRLAQAALGSDHRRVQRRRSAGRDLRALLHRQVNICFGIVFRRRRLSGPAKAPTGRGARIAADK